MPAGSDCMHHSPNGKQVCEPRLGHVTNPAVAGPLPFDDQPGPWFVYGEVDKLSDGTRDAQSHAE
eukprot:10068857-Prorocentrum_lima.AAC.1